MTQHAAQLEKAAAARICVVISQESILLMDAVQRIRDRVCTTGSDLNSDVFRAGDTPMTRVVEAARTLPMMAQRRWVHLYDLHRLKAADTEPLLNYLDMPAESTVLCLSGTKIDKRTKLGKRLGKAGVVIDLQPPKPNDLPRFIMDRVATLGITITAQGAELLSDFVGVDVGNIDRALEQLSLYIECKGAIDVGDVEALIAPMRVHQIFDLTDAIGARDLGRATWLVRNAIEGGEAALRVLAMITRQFRLLLKVKEAKGNDVARTAGVPPFLVRPLMEQAKRYTEQELCRAMDATARAELCLKSTPLDHGVVLDRLLLDTTAKH